MEVLRGIQIDKKKWGFSIAMFDDQRDPKGNGGVALLYLAWGLLGTNSSSGTHSYGNMTNLQSVLPAIGSGGSSS
jgi:hypothetical protein